MTLWQPGLIVTADRLNDGLETEVTSSGLVVASGWTLNEWSAARTGKNVELNLYLRRSGTTITVTNGNIVGDKSLCTVPAGWRPVRGTINSSWDDGTSQGGWVIGGDGLCTLRTASSDITGDATSAGNGRNLRLHISYNQ